MFGTPARRLFGIHHAPDESRGNGVGVLMCNPFGHEAIRIHRLYRVLTDRLVRKGCHVLRFDYFGTGDSMGDDEDGDLLGWQEDILAAHEALRDRSGGTAISWLGARLGASLAIRAASASSAALHRLVLWDPIVDGAAYSSSLRNKHVEALELSFCIPDSAWRRRLFDETNSFLDEALGFATTPLLRGQLVGLALLPEPLAQVDSSVVLARADDHPVTRWVTESAACGQRIQKIPLDHALVWTSDPQTNMAMVPADALGRLALELEHLP